MAFAAAATLRSNNSRTVPKTSAATFDIIKTRKLGTQDSGMFARISVSRLGFWHPGYESGILARIAVSELGIGPAGLDFSVRWVGFRYPRSGLGIRVGNRAFWLRFQYPG